MNRKKFLSDIVAALLVSTATVPAAYAQVTLTLINEYPGTSITATADLQFAEHVEKLSGGALHVKTLQECDNPYDETSKSVFEGLGAESVHLPYSALAEKLAADEVNAVLTSGDGGAGRSLWNHLPHFTAVNYSIPLSYTIINKDVWNSLDSEQRAILNKAAEQVAQASWSGVEQRMSANYARMRENNMTLNTEPSSSVMDALRKAGAKETEAWLKKNKLTKNEAACLS